MEKHISEALSDRPSSSSAFTPASDCSTEVDHHSGSAVPWHNSTYIIQNVATGKVLSLQGGNICLVSLGGRECVYWDSIEHDGWLGFQQPHSAKYLGYNRGQDHALICTADKHNIWEYFCVRQRRDGHYMLLMPTYAVLTSSWQRLKPVGVQGDTVKVIEDWNDKSTAWKFIEI
jgi:hypothetical protein